MSIKLRPLQAADAADLAMHANNVNIANNLTDQFPHPYSLENATTFISTTSAADPPNVL